MPKGPNGWVFRTPGHKYDRNVINVRAHGKASITVMVWGCIWRGGRSPLVIMERDSDSTSNGYTATSYIRALEEGLAPYYRPGTFFLQDNARIHTARATKEWLEVHGIWVQEHPPHSPDINPIEHVWAIMKEALQKEFPDLHKLPKNNENIKRVETALRSVWDSIPQAEIDNLIDSMPRRLRAVIRAKGWYTKY